MSIKRLAKQSLAAVSPTQNYTLGAYYLEMEDGVGENLYKYIEYYGNTITTAGTYTIVVPHAETTMNPVKYSSDKVNMVVDAWGSFSAITIGPFTSTNKYGFVQVRGKSHARNSMPAGGITVGEKLKSSAAGTDKRLEIAGTTTYAQGVFAVALAASTGASNDPSIYLLGLGVGI
jgi:hypothetical protein